MRRLRLISAMSLALAAAPHSSAQQQKLPAHFANWSGQPSPLGVETEAPLNYADLWKETGRMPDEFCEYLSGGAKIGVDLQKYRDPSSAYEMYTALISPKATACLSCWGVPFSRCARRLLFPQRIWLCS